VSGHTAGPWVAEPADMFGDHNIIRGDGLELLAIAAVVSNMRPSKEVHANARLVAAAPTLLEACEGIEGVLLDGIMNCPERLAKARDQLRTAIELAKTGGAA